MSAVVEVIESATGALVDAVEDTWDVVKDTVTYLWEEVALPVVEFVFSLLGITDEDVLAGDVLTQRMLKDDAIGNLPLTAALQHQHNKVPILETLAVEYANIKARYNRYYSSDFIDGAPEATLRARVVNTSTVGDVLNDVLGYQVEVLIADLRVPNKNEWVYWVLQNDYSGTSYNGQITYTGDTWYVGNILYNYTTDKYEVDIESRENVTTSTYTKTVVTVVNYDETQDEVTTEVFTEVYIVGDKSGPISDSSVLESSIVELVDIGTVEDSDTSVLVDEVVSIEVYDTDVLEIVAYSPVHMYIAKYYVSGGDENEWYYWIYNPATNVYPELNAGTTYTNNLEMLPIVAVKHDSSYLEEDTDRYESSKNILSTIGIDINTIIDGIKESPDEDKVKDAFIYFGMNPNDDSEIISKTLFHMADIVYGDAGLYSDGVEGSEESVFSFSIKEGNFRQVAKWDSQSRVIKNGVLARKYEHEVNGTTLTLRAQLVEEEYVEYEFSGVSSMTYIQYGGQGTLVTKDLGDEAFYVPISMEFVRNLSAKEQAELYVRTLIISMYAAEIIHLEFYETPRFATFLKVVAIVIFVLSLGSATGLSQVLWTIAVAIASSYALKLVLESNAPDWLKAAAAIAYVAVNIYVGNGNSFADLGIMTGVQVVALTSSAVMAYTQVEMEKLQKKSEAFQQRYEDRMEELNAKESSLDTNLDVTEVAELVIRPDRMSTSTMYDIAKGSMLYNAGSAYYNLSDRLYDYDSKFRIGEY